MKRHILILQAIAIMTFAACSLNEEPGSVAEEGTFENTITVVNASISDFNMDDGTRTSITPVGVFSWNTDDKLGFWPIKAGESGSQAIFYVSDTRDEGHSATFKANSWGLINGYSYAACYPYDENSTAGEVQISFDNQVPSGNGSTAHLGEFDYLHAVIAVNQNGAAQDVEFAHLGCLTKYTFSFDENIPAETKFTGLTLSADGEPFVTSAAYNPLNSTVTLDDQKSGSFTLNFGEDFTIADGKVIVYAMMGKSDWSGKTITAKLFAEGLEEDSYYGGTFSGKNMTAANGGYGYKSTLSLTDGYINLSKQETANCYIASGAGSYKFKATKGFGGADFKPASVGVYWATYNTPTAPSSLNDLVTNVTTKNGNIYFDRQNANTGNVIIAARDNDNKIIWTWHIWCVAGVEDVISAGGMIMDRNLGALITNTASTSAATSGLCAGFNYQWGRKDPFINISNINITPGRGSQISLAAANPSDVFPTTNGSSEKDYGKVILTNKTDNSSYDHYVANPTWFCIAGSAVEGFDWSGDVKTPTDPCPPGYRVGNSDFIGNGDINKFPKAGEISGKLGDTEGTYGWCNIAAYVWTNDAASNRRKLMDGAINIDSSENRTMSGAQVRCQKISQ